MRRSSLKVVLVLLLTAGITVPSLSQSRQTGSIFGRVLDNEGNSATRCSITLYGPKLLGQRLYITSDPGIFRFHDLPPGGGYEVRVEMPGFKTVVRTGLLVNTGKVTEILVRLETAALEEEVTVPASSPVVDVQTSKVSINYGAEFIAHIPLNRDLYDIQNSAPGAVTDDDVYKRASSLLGGTDRSILYTLDGVPMNDPSTYCAVANINVDVYEEVEIGIGALPAEAGQAASTYINVVTKSGSNDYSAGITGYYTSDSLTQSLITPEELDVLNVFEPESFSGYKDLSLDWSGAIVPDKFWFFLNARRLVWDKTNPFTPENRLENLGIKKPHFDLGHQEWLTFIKFTFQLTSSIRYTGWFHYNHLYEPYYGNRIAADTTSDVVDVWNHENTYTTSHQINWVFNQNAFLNIRGSFIQRNFPLNARPRTESDYSYYDREENVYWGRTFYDDDSILRKYTASVSLTRFEEDFLGAAHEFKVGAEYEQGEYYRDWYRKNPWYSYWLDYAEGNPYYYSDAGQQGRLRVAFCPSQKGSWNVQDHVRRLSGFLQDSLTAGRLAVNLGLRFDWAYAYRPQQSRPELRYEYGPDQQNPDLGSNDLLEALIAQMHDSGLVTPFDALTVPWKKVVEFITVSPRIGIVYDIFGNGKTALKFHFGRYYEPIWANRYNTSQIFSPGTYNWLWNDINGNKLMDLPPTDTYELEYTTNQDPEIDYYVEGLKAPYIHELQGGIEHELAKDFRIRLDFIYRSNGNIVEEIDKNNAYDPDATDESGAIWIPYEFIDPGFDAEFGTDDDQRLTVYGLREDRPAPEEIGTNPPEARRRYYAGILTLSKRMSDHWQLEGSILYSAFKGNASARYGTAGLEEESFSNPNSRINSYGRLYFDRPLQIKLLSTIMLPYDFTLSAYFHHRSGIPWTRTLGRVYFPEDFGVKESFVWVRAEERGAQRKASYTNMDLRLEKSFALGERTKMNVSLDIFNLFGARGINLNDNPNGVLYYDRTPPEYQLDPLYGTASNVYGVRTFRIGVRFVF